MRNIDFLGAIKKVINSEKPNNDFCDKFYAQEMNGASKKPVTPTILVPKPKPRTSMVLQNNNANNQANEGVWTNGETKEKKPTVIQRRTVITTEI